MQCQISENIGLKPMDYHNECYLLCDFTSVAEPPHFSAAPASAPGVNFDAAPAPAPTLLYSKAKFLKRIKV
jgi:hypothetical protein